MGVGALTTLNLVILPDVVANGVHTPSQVHETGVEQAPAAQRPTSVAGSPSTNRPVGNPADTLSESDTGIALADTPSESDSGDTALAETLGEKDIGIVLPDTLGESDTGDTALDDTLGEKDTGHIGLIDTLGASDTGNTALADTMGRGNHRDNQIDSHTEPPVPPAVPDAVAEVPPTPGSTPDKRQDAENTPVLVVLFDLDSATLNQDSRRALAALAASLRNTSEQIRIECSADRLGPRTHNEQLAINRCHNVRVALQREGISRRRIRAHAIGEAQTTATGDTHFHSRGRLRLPGESSTPGSIRQGVEADPETGNPQHRAARIWRQ